MEKSVDRRILRTRKAIREALIDLIVLKGYDDIKIQDITEKADIGRSTFYAHYSTKDAVFLDSFIQLKSWLKTCVDMSRVDRKRILTHRLEFIAPLCVHINEDRKLYQALVGHRGGGLARDEIRKILFEHIREDVERRCQPRNPPKVMRDALIHYLVGAIIGVLSWWLDTKNSWAPEEVDEFLQSMIAPSLEKICSDYSVSPISGCGLSDE